MAYSHNVANEYTGIGGTNVSHDAAGNMTLDHRGYQYAYDHDNRLTKIEKRGDSGNTTVAEYTYDALGRRIEAIDSVAATTTRYYYDGWRVLSETNAADAVQRSYVYGNYLDEVLIKRQDSADLYYAHNHLYSPVALMEDDGDVVERYEYDVYGKQHVMEEDYDPRDSSSYDNVIAFTGQRLDSLDDGDLNLMYYKNRHYCTTTGRFLQRDPIGVNNEISMIDFGFNDSPRFKKYFYPDIFADEDISMDIHIPKFTINRFSAQGTPKYLYVFQPTLQYVNGANVYQYALNNPTNYIDIYGLTPEAKKKCKWNGTISGSFFGSFLGGRAKVSVHAVGTDGCNNYAVSGSGSLWLGGAAFGIGYFSASAEIKNHEASCQWPLGKGAAGSITILGAGGTVGVPINLSLVIGTAGSLRGTGFCSTGGVNVFISGGAWAAEFDDIKRVGPTPIK